MAKSPNRRIITYLLIAIAIYLLASVIVYGPPPDLPQICGTFMMPEDSLYAKIHTGFVMIEPSVERVCFDCHSDYPGYPWYYRLIGIRQIIQNDIEEGRKHLNMTTGFPFGDRTDAGSQIHYLEEIIEVIEDGEMPPRLYKIGQWTNLLSNDEKQAIINWARRSIEMIEKSGRLSSN